MAPSLVRFRLVNSPVMSADMRGLDHTDQWNRHEDNLLAHTSWMGRTTLFSFERPRSRPKATRLAAAGQNPHVYVIAPKCDFTCVSRPNSASALQLPQLGRHV